jgi:hypothetical protein
MASGAHRTEQMFDAQGLGGRIGTVTPVAASPLDRPRFRCTACGNLTRFDVTIARRSRAFHHYTVAGELTVEDEEVLDERVEDVACRWCGTGTAVERLVDEERA